MPLIRPVVPANGRPSAWFRARASAVAAPRGEMLAVELRAGGSPRREQRPGRTADAIALAILFAIEQPDDVDVSEIIVRPTNER